MNKKVIQDLREKAMQEYGWGGDIDELMAAHFNKLADIAEEKEKEKKKRVVWYMPELKYLTEVRV